MTFGLRIRGTHGFIQIDQDYDNEVLVAKGTVRTTGGGSYYSYTMVGGGSDIYQTWHADVDAGLPDDSYSIALRSEAACLLLYMTVVDGRMVFRVLTRGQADVEWYVFGPPFRAPAPTGNWGLRIRNPATGRTRYDSRLQYQKIVGEVSHKPIVGLAGQNTNFPVDGRKLAVLGSRPTMQWRQSPAQNPQAPGSYVLCASSFAFLAGNTRIDVVPTAIASGAAGSTTPGGQPVDSNYPETGVFYFVDVTGL